MTVSSVKIEPLKDVKQWFKVTFKSETNVGESEIELLCSDETLRWMRVEIRKAFGEKPDYSDLPDNIRRMMEGD